MCTSHTPLEVDIQDGFRQIRTHILGVLALNPHRDNDLNCFVLIFANKSNLKGTDSEEQFLPKVWNRNWK